MRRGFWEQIWLSFLEVQGLIIGILSIALSFALWYFIPGFTVTLGLIAPIVILLIFFVVVLSHATYTSLHTNNYSLPKIIYVKSPAPANQGILLCLLEPSDLFSYDLLVSFYHVEENFEQIIGIGSVINIQEDKKIQVVMTYYISEDNNLLQEFSRSNFQIISKVRIKPNAPKTYLDRIPQNIP